jgi:uncharacterized protein (DUF169 family)
VDLSKKLLDTIETYIRPYSFPVAVKMATSEMEMSKFLSPIKALDHRIGVCQAIGLSRRMGWDIHYTQEDHVCPGSYMIFGYTEVPDLVKEGGGFHYPVYSATPELGKETQKHMQRLEIGELHSLFLSPLKKLRFVPDLVLVYGNPAQIVRFIQAIVYSEGGVVTSNFMGRGACASSIVVPYKTKMCNVVIQGGGERMFGIADDTELIFSIPYNKFQSVITGIEATHKQGVSRIPTPFMGMTMEPKFPQSYMEAARFFSSEFPKQP